MTKNSGVHRVIFENATTETVTFVLELRGGPQSAFTLIPGAGPGASHYVDVQVQALTNEQYRLVVGENSDGRSTNECVSTDELPGLDRVVVTRNETSGNNFVLEKHPRNANAGRLSAVTRLCQQGWSWFRNGGASRDSLGA